MNQHKNTPFIKLFLRFAILFLVLVSIFKIVSGFFRFDGLEGLQNEYFVDGKWQLFLQTQLLMSLIYGLLMTGYYKLIKK